MGPLHNKQALLFILLIVCQATIWYTPDFHKWKVIFLPVENKLSTLGTIRGKGNGEWVEGKQMRMRGI